MLTKKSTKLKIDLFSLAIRNPFKSFAKMSSDLWSDAH